MTDNKPPPDAAQAISQPETRNSELETADLMDGDLLAQLEDQPWLWRRIMLAEKRHTLAVLCDRTHQLTADIAQIRANPVLTAPLREMMIEVRQDHLRRLLLHFDDCAGSNYPFSLN